MVKNYNKPADFGCDRVKRFLDKCMSCPKEDKCQEWEHFLDYVRKRKELFKK